MSDTIYLFFKLLMNFFLKSATHHTETHKPGNSMPAAFFMLL